MAEWSMATDCKSVSLYSRWFESNFSQSMVLKRIIQKKRTNRTQLTKISRSTTTGLVNPQTPKLFFTDYYYQQDSGFAARYLQLQKQAYQLNHKPLFSSNNPQIYATLNLILITLINTYKTFFFKPAVEFFFVKKHAEKLMVTSFYYLNFKFKRNLFFINIYNNVNQNYMSLSLGLFLKFFNKKKSL